MGLGRASKEEDFSNIERKKKIWEERAMIPKLGVSFLKKLNILLFCAVSMNIIFEQRGAWAASPLALPAAAAAAAAAIILFLLLPPGSSALAPGFCTDNTCNAQCVKEPFPGSVFYVTGGYDPNNLNPASCMSACSSLNGIELAGITAGNVCVCGKESTGCESENGVCVVCCCCCYVFF